MDRKDLQNAITVAGDVLLQGGTTGVHCITRVTLMVLREAAVEQLKTMPAPVAVTTYVVTACFRADDREPTAVSFSTSSSELAKSTYDRWNRRRDYHDVQWTEIVSHG